MPLFGVQWFLTLGKRRIKQGLIKFHDGHYGLACCIIDLWFESGTCKENTIGTCDFRMLR